LHDSALNKSCLHLGAWIGGEPPWNPDFNTADLLIFLPLTRLAARHARHFPQERRAA
jgi:putative hemolysin